MAICACTCLSGCVWESVIYVEVWICVKVQYVSWVGTVIDTALYCFYLGMITVEKYGRFFAKIKHRDVCFHLRPLGESYALHLREHTQ